MISYTSSTVLNEKNAAAALHNNTSMPSDHHGPPLQFQLVNQLDREPNAENMAEEHKHQQSMMDNNRTKLRRTLKQYQPKSAKQHTRMRDNEPKTTRRQHGDAQWEPAQQHAPRCIDTRLHDRTWNMDHVIKGDERDQDQIVYSTWTADRQYSSAHIEGSNHPVHSDIGQQQRQKGKEQVQRHTVVSHDEGHHQMLPPSHLIATGGAKQGAFRFLSEVWTKIKRSKSPSSSPSKFFEPTQAKSTPENIDEKEMVRSKGARSSKRHGFIGDSKRTSSQGHLVAGSPLQSSTSTVALHTPGAPSFQYGTEKGANYRSRSSFDFDHDLSAWQNHFETQGEPALVSSSPAQTPRSQRRSSKGSSRTASSYRRRSTQSHRSGHSGPVMDDGTKTWLGLFTSVRQLSHSASSTGSSVRSSSSSTTFASSQRVSREKKRRSKQRTTDSAPGSPPSPKENLGTNIEKLPQVKSTGPRKLSIVVVGDGAVGKSALTLRFLRDQYDPTIEDSYCKYIVVDGIEYTLDITDTAGQSEYRGHWNDQFIREGDGFICVYSIASLGSFKELVGFRDQIWRAKECEQVPIMMVGNKCDLERKGSREVSTAVGAQFAQQSNALFVETSAKTGVNILEMIIELVRDIERKRQLSQQMDHSRGVTEVVPPTKSMGYCMNATPPARTRLEMDADVKKGHCGCTIM
ncbi:hypothetical protein BG011_009279 [Mortierella polycephala]|uniref:Ras-domain-containing protein n=1 Tax=Mortierella polycephala TaxID=41804 RepID=A0A9P6PMI1_9FUNG|nr:hypothetical protein BG011_009279 [Mortierella polycephala]